MVEHWSPRVYAHSLSGGFSVLGSNHIKEETLEKDTQMAGGKGSILNPGAIYRYYLNAEYRSKLSTMLETVSSSSNHTNFHCWWNECGEAIECAK